MKQHIKFLLCPFLLVFALSSCKIYPPEYKRVENFRLERIDKDGFKVFGNIVMYNPNKMRVRLRDMHMEVKMNGKHVANAEQLIEVPIKGKSEFGVPLDIAIKPDMSLWEGVKDVFKILTKQEMDVTLEGDVLVKAYGHHFAVPIQQNEKVDINLIKNK